MVPIKDVNSSEHQLLHKVCVLCYRLLIRHQRRQMAANGNSCQKPPAAANGPHWPTIAAANGIQKAPVGACS
jgi:hypothetical protein